MDLRTLLAVAAAARPNFMVLTPACVLLGAAAAIHEAGRVEVADALLALLGAALAHAAVNLLNEYDDFRSGLDAITVRTPFSGGSGALPANPQAAPAALVAGVLCLAGTAAVGGYFAWARGAAIVPLGLLGLAIVVAYTPWITRRPLVCLLAPGLGFGPLMVMGTAFVLTGRYGAAAAWASLVPLFLVSELLLVNQFPDIEADRKVGRDHLPIRLGRRASARIYAALLLAAFAVPPAGVALGLLPGWSLLALTPLPLALFLARGVVRHAEDQARLVPLLGLNVALILGTITLYAAGILIGAWAGG
jgi:1,4-dihydroxy-2-naphthoate polyprenyltransferase